MTQIEHSRYLSLLAAVLTAVLPAAGQFVRYPDPVRDPLIVGLENFSSKYGGWGDFNTHPRLLGDVNGDGRADIIGFGDQGVYVALALEKLESQGFRNIVSGNSLQADVHLQVNKRFSDPALWISAFYSKSGGFVSQENYPRLVGDVNGDGKADIVGFVKDGAYVSLSTGSSFATPAKWIANYGQDAGAWSSFDGYPRALGDVNGDGKADIVGFGDASTFVSLSTGASFGPPVAWINNFARNAGGWASFDRLPRHLADVNGDGRADIVGFGDAAVFVSLSTGSSFQAPANWVTGFVESAGGWTSQSQYPRFVVDVNKDKKADIVGFGEENVSVALSTGGGFAAPVIWSARMTNMEGWTGYQEMPRLLGDYLGNGLPGLVGFSPDGVRIVPNIDGKGFEQLEPDLQLGPAETYCWKDNYTRGAGVLGNACASGYEEWGGDCYPKCPAGMVGLGPLCWQTCPAGYADMGVSCVKPKATSSAGYGWQFGDKAFDFDTGPRARCEAAYGAGKCYKSGLIWYPSCPAYFHKVGDLVCSPDCPSGMRDDGAYCAKNTSPRGAGVAKTCASGMVSDAGLCYPACNPVYDGIGPVCWSKCTGTYPQACAAGCATNQATCAANIGLMTVNTANAVGSVLNFVVGGPGIGAATKVAAKAAQSAARQAVAKSLWKSSLAGLSGSWAGLARNAARDTAIKTFALTLAKSFGSSQVLDGRNLFWNMTSLYKSANLKMLNQVANENGQVKANNDVDLSYLTILDVTGISSAVLSFTRYSSCGTEPITPLTKSMDLGNIGSNEGTQSVTIKVNKPTTFLHVGTPAYSNCSIVPSSTCMGKILQPGESCTVSVKAQTGGQSLLGELRIYTEDLNVIPYPIQLKANSGSATECRVINEVEEAANMTNLVGAWAWNNDISKKIVIGSDGSVTPVGSWTTPGTVAVQDPNQRTFLFKFGGATGPNGEFRTLSRLNDTLDGPNTQATKRPWDPRCAPGMDYVQNSCWDTPVGKLLFVRPGRTPMGVYSDPCPADYQDDPVGDRCRPRWNGKYVWGTPEYPSIVTDCSMRTCPANFTKNACSCVAVDKPKATQTANWFPTVN